ncbi:probable E3 ubiquitin-protein ligase MID2 [Strongylocentrotus purpuratus]|uniref:Uncharacterized protein n=1 Tax=Strongylocentrotus purpuratus TaxID=7668 RepID=A0A7M7PHT8_STRPU|nr:probable E3 ubiquitin-protein ligase MID2 [Strongylocentrotus purpuratus]
MAEKTEEEKAPSPPENLTCPLCLDIFDEATILTLCGHTFCRKCLKNYDLSHQGLDHMICPLCRNITKLTANRVDDFLTDMAVKGLVDDYHAKCGEMNAVLELCPRCTACRFHEDAVSFCKTCNLYMCTNCDYSHNQLTSLFEGHEIVSLQDIINGKVTIGHLSEKCCIHKQENKDMFCEDCKVHVCFKCVIVGHQNHKIKNQADFEQELQLKVNELVERCASKKSELEKNIQNVEVQRHEVYTAMQKLLDDVSQAYSIKAKELEENHRNLIERINAVKRSFDDDLNVLKSNDRTRIKSIYSSVTLVANDRLGRLETDSLSAHTLLCEELDAMLKEATDHTSAAAITKKAQEERFKPADDTRLDLGSISESVPNLQVILCVDLRERMSGMTPYSGDSVAIGYLDKHEHNATRQVSSTRSGLIVTSSCNINPSVVTVYDRDGNAGESVRAPDHVCMFAAVDEQDIVYVASVDSKNENVVFRLYDLDGLNLKERVEFNVLNLKLRYTWCYLVSLSPDMLAFACDKELYFIKVSL